MTRFMVNRPLDTPNDVEGAGRVFLIEGLNGNDFGIRRNPTEIRSKTGDQTR